MVSGSNQRSFLAIEEINRRNQPGRQLYEIVGILVIIPGFIRCENVTPLPALPFEVFLMIDLKWLIL
jgi:hypothetical protein